MSVKNNNINKFLPVKHNVDSEHLFNIGRSSALVFMLFLMTGCNTDNANSDDAKDVKEKSGQIASMDDLDARIEKRIEDRSHLMQQRLENSHAKLAAKRSDTCPKLVMTEVDTQVIQRNNETMKSEHCDYYIYPKLGAHIMAASDCDKLKLLLIRPEVHNFANGAYPVNREGRYVIRAKYDGIRMIKGLNYNINIKVQ